ncbi:MAG: HEAT repeat domain-containing protein, partial [Planctomycetaceae bacterium]|nr:HEAT repeat domain-containing protein [Planctomycetaceae bacterium]
MFKLPVLFLTFLAIVTTASAQGQTDNPVQKRVEMAVSQLKSGNADQQFAALAELGDMGPLAKSAVSDLVATLKASNDIALQHEVLIALERIGTEANSAIPTIAKYLDNESPVLQHQALHTLRQMGPLAKPVVPQVLKALESQSPVISTAAAWTLASIADDVTVKRQAALVLVNGLKSKDPNILSDSVTGLSELGKPAVSGLSNLLSDSNSAIAMHAADALGLMGPVAAPATGELLKSLQHQDENVAAHAAQALGAIASNPKTVVPALTEQLGSQSEMIRIASAFSLGRFGGDAKSAVPQLAKTLSDSSVDVRVAAAQALASIGPDAAGAVPQLNKAIDDTAGLVTLSAFEALGAIKGPAVDVLVQRMDDPNYLPLAAAVLGQIGPDAAPATLSLVNRLQSTKDPEAQFEILVALGSIGPKAEKAVEPLMKLAKTGKDRTRRGAIYALAK